MSKSTISTFQLFEMFPTPESARIYLESRLWPDGPFCPECKKGGRVGNSMQSVEGASHLYNSLKNPQSLLWEHQTAESYIKNMKVAELAGDLTELDQKAEVWFTRYEKDQLIYLVSALPDGTKVCHQLPTAINKNEIKQETKK